MNDWIRGIVDLIDENLDLVIGWVLILAAAMVFLMIVGMALDVAGVV